MSAKLTQVRARQVLESRPAPRLDADIALIPKQTLGYCAPAVFDDEHAAAGGAGVGPAGPRDGSRCQMRSQSSVRDGHTWTLRVMVSRLQKPGPLCSRAPTVVHPSGARYVGG
jgi:hypothetical protein